MESDMKFTAQLWYRGLSMDKRITTKLPCQHRSYHDDMLAFSVCTAFGENWTYQNKPGMKYSLESMRRKENGSENMDSTIAFHLWYEEGVFVWQARSIIVIARWRQVCLHNRVQPCGYYSLPVWCFDRIRLYISCSVPCLVFGSIVESAQSSR